MRACRAVSWDYDVEICKLIGLLRRHRKMTHNRLRLEMREVCVLQA